MLDTAQLFQRMEQTLLNPKVQRNVMTKAN